MKILFTRHGESEANVLQIISNRDLPHGLTVKGRAQAQALAEQVAKYDMRAIYCSPIPRARETAEIVADALELTFQITPALLEFDCGMVEGRGDEEAWQAHHETVRAWDEEQDYDRFIPPDGESFNDMKARFLPLLDQIRTGSDDLRGDVLLISHGSMLHQMLPLILNNIDREFTRRNGLGNCAIVVVEPRDSLLVCTEWDGRRL